MTMKTFPVLLIVSAFLPFVQLQFAPTVEVYCGPEPTYTFEVENATDTGVIFISGRCEAQNTTGSAETNYTFVNASCSTGGIPAINETFLLVIQQFPTFNLDDDLLLEVVCLPNLTSVTTDVTANTNPQDTDDTAIGDLSPTFSAYLEDEDGNEISSGSVGDDVKLEVEIGDGMAEIFDFYVESLGTAADSTVVKLVENGCSLYSSVFPHPTRQTDGKFEHPFKLFIPRNTLSDPSAPETARVVTYSFRLEICSKLTGGCSPPSCGGRRRRSAATDQGFNNRTVEFTAQFLVYPSGKDDRGITYDQQTEADDNVCLTQAGFTGLLVGFLSILAVCVIVGACLFVRTLRKSSLKERDSAYSNKSYEK